MTKKQQLYYLINEYYNCNYDTVTFCNTYYDVFYPNIPTDELSEFELDEFKEIGKVVSRFSQYKEDFTNCPNAFYNEDDVKSIVEAVYKKLC